MGSEKEQYRLEIGGYQGTAGDSLNDPWYGSNLRPFSTFDRYVTTSLNWIKRHRVARHSKRRKRKNGVERWKWSKVSIMQDWNSFQRQRPLEPELRLDAEGRLVVEVMRQGPQWPLSQRPQRPHGETRSASTFDALSPLYLFLFMYCVMYLTDWHRQSQESCGFGGAAGTTPSKQLRWWSDQRSSSTTRGATTTDRGRDEMRQIFPDREWEWEKSDVVPVTRCRKEKYCNKVTRKIFGPFRESEQICKFACHRLRCDNFG